MPSNTGVWNQQEADTAHIFSYKLAKWIADFTKRVSKKPAIWDIGCGKGTYTNYFNDRGIECFGVDGFPYEGMETENYVCHDLTNEIKLTQAPVVVCLEVGEHIPSEHFSTFIANILNASSEWVILSWAVPGQDGIGHVNCVSNEVITDELWKRNFQFMPEETREIRKQPENYVSYFRDTLLIFKRIS